MSFTATRTNKPPTRIEMIIEACIRIGCFHFYFIVFLLFVYKKETLWLWSEEVKDLKSMCDMNNILDLVSKIILGLKLKLKSNIWRVLDDGLLKHNSVFKGNSYTHICIWLLKSVSQIICIRALFHQAPIDS